jgi:tRNA wybutosine-synthesizing protein 1
MIVESARKELEKQQYRIVGLHSAVKTCGWTKNMLRGEGGCYKLKFYGIMSNQCMQMTTSISCANRCRFCWRGYKAPVSKEWKWGVDDPQFILDESKKQHHKLLEGFKGNEKVSKGAYEKSQTIKHVALSLTGEPITYPRINELIEKFNKDHISTFLVTNAQYPESIKNLSTVTQLYISLDAPEKEMLKDIDVPLFEDYWERLMLSLEYMAEKKYRTCIRLTHVKGMNDSLPEKYAELIMKADPDFIEVKGYMHVGASRERLSIEHMPWHEDVVEFSKQIETFLPDYGIVTEHVPSRAVMMAKKKYFRDGQWWTWIDFEKYNALVNTGKEFSTEEYIKPTPNVGLSGRNTRQEAEEKRNRILSQPSKEADSADKSKADPSNLHEFAEQDLQ